MNDALSLFHARLFIYAPSSPFNLEKMWFESILPNEGRWKFGIHKKELFANYDDDNGFYGESLIKRGLYPFSEEVNVSLMDISRGFIKRTITLSKGEFFDLLYHSAISRINKPPIVFVKLEVGSILFKSDTNELMMAPGDSRSIYSNKGAVLEAFEESVLELKIYDELF